MIACGQAAGGISVRTKGVSLPRPCRSGSLVSIPLINWFASPTVAVALGAPRCSKADLVLVNAVRGRLNSAVDCSNLHWPSNPVAAVSFARCQRNTVMTNATEVAMVVSPQRGRWYKSGRRKVHGVEYVSPESVVTLVDTLRT